MTTKEYSKKRSANIKKKWILSELPIIRRLTLARIVSPIFDNMPSERYVQSECKSLMN